MKTEETLLLKLEREFYSHFDKTSLQPTLIVMHPETHYELTNEIRDDYMKTYNGELPLKYRGVQIFRSSDIEKGVIKIA